MWRGIFLGLEHLQVWRFRDHAVSELSAGGQEAEAMVYSLINTFSNLSTICSCFQNKGLRWRPLSASFKGSATQGQGGLWPHSR